MPIALLYHDVVAPGEEQSSGFPGPGALRYKLAPDDFAAHLDAIADALDQGGGGSCRAGAPLLTFDDGGASALQPTACLLEAHGWRGRFFITTDCVGRPAFLSAAGVRELRTRGHTVGSHTCSHPPRVSACPRRQILDEWRRSRAFLEDLLGETVSAASVPGGYYSRAVAETAAIAGFTDLFTSEPTTRAWSVAGMQVLGRYTIVRGAAAERAAALACGRFLPCARQALLWQVRKAAKAFGGGLYVQLREMMLARTYSAQRGRMRAAP